MLKHYCILLLLIILNYLILPSSGLNLMTTRKADKFDIMNRILVFLLKSCNFHIKNTVVYDKTNSLSTFETISKLQPPMSVSLLSDWFIVKDRKMYEEFVQVDGVVLVVNPYNNFHGIDVSFSNKWLYKPNCTIFILPKPYVACAEAWPILMSMTRLYLPTTYYICLNKWDRPVVFTFNSYGDTKPLFWVKDQSSQNPNYNWTLYYRFIDKDSIKTCKGFYFERNHPTNESYAILGILNLNFDDVNEPDERWIYGEDIEQYMQPHIMEHIDQLKKLTKLKFQYNLLQADSIAFAYRAYEDLPIDVIMFFHFTLHPNFDWHYFHPVNFDDYSIMSYNRGLKSPVEKIVNFYGFWTLISLISLSTMVFIVVWFKTNKSIYAAAFDVIRLLIDSEVVVPIDTLSLKIFFCMIFLYFMVIHATFSGHLAEFLTQSEFRRNVETIEDLTDPRIEMIYNYVFPYNDNEDSEILLNKTITIFIAELCPTEVLKTPNSVCIGQTFELLKFRSLQKDWNNTFYISKKTLRSLSSAFVHRPRFPLREKMNWAMMFLGETKIFGRFLDEEYKGSFSALDKQMKLSEIDFRPIQIEDIKFALIFLLIGNSIGLICFLGELSISWYRKKKITKIRPNIQELRTNKTYVRITVRRKMLIPLHNFYKNLSK